LSWLDLSARRQDTHHSPEEWLRRDRLRAIRSRAGFARDLQRQLPRLCLRPAECLRSRLRDVFWRVTELDRQHGRALTAGATRGRRGCVALPARLQLEVVCRESE